MAASACELTFFERQKRQAAGARFLRAGMSATGEPETPIIARGSLQTAFPKLHAIWEFKSGSKTLDSMEVFERVSSVKHGCMSRDSALVRSQGYHAGSED